jgi:hypothetical protein
MKKFIMSKTVIDIHRRKPVNFIYQKYCLR